MNAIAARVKGWAALKRHGQNPLRWFKADEAPALDALIVELARALEEESDRLCTHEADDQPECSACGDAMAGAILALGDAVRARKSIAVDHAATPVADGSQVKLNADVEAHLRARAERSKAMALATSPAPDDWSTFLGPCAHGRDPYTRCEEGCGDGTAEQAMFRADALHFAEAALGLLKGWYVDAHRARGLVAAVHTAAARAAELPLTPEAEAFLRGLYADNPQRNPQADAAAVTAARMLGLLGGAS